MESKLALVMTGGGARAAYQVGVTRALYEITRKKQGLFDIITGNSAGAINATYLAANAQDWNLATDQLMTLWKNLVPQVIYDLRARSITEIGLKWLSGTVFGGLTEKGTQVNHLLDTTPLRKLIQREIDFSQINHNIHQGILRGVALSTTNYNSGSNVIFYQGSNEVRDWSRSDRFSMRCDLTIDQLMASAAIPFFFPPIKVGESYYGDGCIRQTTPLSPAIHLGAQKIIAVGIRYPHHQARMRDMAMASIPNPTIGQITGVLMNAIFLDSLEADVERMNKINDLIKQGTPEHFKSIPIYVIRPSRDLGKMTEKLDQQLPPILRYLLKGIGVSGKEGLDLLSYLAFDSSYTQPLVELGHEDTIRQKDDILRFIDA
jgi:NTE family protein